MKIILFVTLWLVVIFGSLPLTAQITIVPVQNLIPTSGPAFQAQDGGITILAGFPANVAGLNSLNLTLTLLNETKKDLSIRDYGSVLRGFDFYLEDASNRKLDLTERFKIRHEASTNYAAVGGGYQTTILENGNAIVINIPVNQFIPVNSLGEYILHVSWRDSERVGNLWRPASETRLKLTGKILLKKSSKGISISSIK